MKIPLLSCLVIAAELVLAFSTGVDTTSAPLQIQLIPLGNTRVKASVTNTGSQGYNLLRTGSFLDDDAPVDKFIVHGSAGPATFRGLVVQVSDTNLNETQFLSIQPSQVIETMIDVAELYDVKISDLYTIQVKGSLAYAEIGSTILTGRSVAFASNIISMDIDGEEASKVRYVIDILSWKRTELSCSDKKNAVVKQAVENCAMLASNASSAVQSGHLVQEYFKSTSSSVVSEVVQRFDAVAQECSSTMFSKSSVMCSDPSGLCDKPGYIAHTNPDTNVVTLCDIFFTSLDPLTRDCGVQDQANTLVHELTHCSGVYSPYTLDYAYGPAVKDLPSDEAVLNADTYRMYAGAIYGKCDS